MKSTGLVSPALAVQGTAGAEVIPLPDFKSTTKHSWNAPAESTVTGWLIPADDVEPNLKGGISIDELVADWESAGFQEDFARLRRAEAAVAIAEGGRATLRSLRLAKGLSQSSLAAMAGMKQPNLARLERDPHPNPGLKTLQCLARALEVDLNTLGEALS